MKMKSFERIADGVMGPVVAGYVAHELPNTNLFPLSQFTEFMGEYVKIMGHGIDLTPDLVGTVAVISAALLDLIVGRWVKDTILENVDVNFTWISAQLVRMGVDVGGAFAITSLIF